ncbi:MAG: type II toxin-antitoxin system VapC family toxin [Pseudonocardiaceae bacterium]
MRNCPDSGTILVADCFVVDTSVFLRWYVPQIGFEHAREVRQDFLAGAVALETVDSTRFELGHVLRTKGLLKGHLSVAQYRAAVRSIDDLGITIHGTDADALERAGELATRCMLRFFDAVFVDRALQRGMPLLTSDRKLANAVGTVAPVEILRGIP